jgi:hypothetical protein
MLSLQSFKEHAGKIMQMAKVDGINLKIYYNQEVFIVNIIRTGEKYIPQRARRARRAIAKKAGVVINLKVCDFCGSLRDYGICVNKQCPGRDKQPEPQL